MGTLCIRKKPFKIAHLFPISNSQSNELRTNVGQLATAWTGPTEGSIVSSPAIVNKIAYIGSTDSKLYAFDAKGMALCLSVGGPKFCSPLWVGTTDSTVMTSGPAVVNGFVYVATQGSCGGGGTFGCSRVWRFNAAGCGSATCSASMNWAASGAIFGSPVVANNVIYAGALDGKLYAFSTTPCTGGGRCAPIWTGATGGP